MKFLRAHMPTIIAATAVLAWLALSMWDVTNPAKTTLSGLFLLTIPGYWLLKLFSQNRWPGHFWNTLGYATGLSVMFLMITGLVVNTAMPWFGITQPLTTMPLALGIASGLGILIVILAIQRQSLLPQIRIPQLHPFEKILAALGVFIPVLGALGAISLNNGGTNAFTLAMLGIIAAYTIVIIWPIGRGMRHIQEPILYLSSLGMLLATSLRGWHITGHDIIQEYQVFQLTNTHSLWSMDFLHDAYNACLSITILPTVLSQLAGLSDPYIYKIIFQFVFALVPVLIYLIISRYTSKQIAFLSAFIFISFPTFMVDMPMLNRQETAFLFFALAFMALFDDQLRRRARSILVILLFAGMILSHYSTSYVALGVIVLAKFLELIVAGYWRLRHHSPAKPFAWMPLSWATTLILILLTYLWNVQVTNTGQGITRTLTGITTNLPLLLSGHTTKTGETSYSLVGKSVTDDEIFAWYTTTAIRTRDLPASEYYPAALTNLYQPTRAHETVDPLTDLGRSIQRLQVPVYHIIETVRQSYAKILQILIVLGLILLAIRSKLRSVVIQTPRPFVLVASAFLGVTALQVLMPSGIIDYGLLRLIQQGLIFLALPIVLAGLNLAGWLRIPADWRVRAVSVVLVAFFVTLSGLIPSLTGGYKPALPTNNAGFYYEAYYTHGAEIAGFTWLKQNAPKGAIVDSDEFARRKMITYAGIYARTAMTPDTIARDAYVYLSYANLSTGKSPVYVDGTLLYQTPPTAFLGATKDVVYNNGKVKIYK